jgi:hypothetical protein
MHIFWQVAHDAVAQFRAETREAVRLSGLFLATVRNGPVFLG